MTMEGALALLALSAPVTVAIVKYVPRRAGRIAAATKGVSDREFRIHTAYVQDQFSVVRADIRELRTLLNRD